MKATVIRYINPAIRAYQDAYTSYHGIAAPEIEQTGRRFVIHGSTGPGRALSEAELLRRTRYLIVWKENERGVA